MSKRIIIKGVTTCDAGHPVADSRLDAIDVGKVIALGRIWTGDLKARLDRLIDEIESLDTPFAVGRILHAEEGPQGLKLGKVFDGLKAVEDALSEVKKIGSETDDSTRSVIATMQRNNEQYRNRKGGKAEATRDGSAAPQAGSRNARLAEMNRCNREYRDRKRSASQVK